MKKNKVSASSILKEVRRVLKVEGNALLSCADRLSSNRSASASIVQAVELMGAALDRGGKIVVTGVGKSGKVGQKIAATLSSTGSLAIFLHPTEGLHGDLGVVTSRDVVLALSYTGNSDELVQLLPSIRSRGVSVIGVGGFPHSRVAKLCDTWVDARVEKEACPHNLAPTSSTTLALALGDALAVALMRVRGFQVKAFAENHPGGALGKRLNLRVSDLMHQGAEVPRVSPQASMDEVIEKLTRKKLGAVLVVQKQILRGIITDGDLRRALQHREQFFNLRASDVMTKNPITVDSQLMAEDALRIMEERSSQISVLPVVKSRTKWVGLLRLHDLVSTL